MTLEKYIEEKIQKEKPQTVNHLLSLLNSLQSEYPFNYDVKQVFYKGYKQGIKVKINGQCIPNKVYSIFKLGF